MGHPRDLRHPALALAGLLLLSSAAQAGKIGPRLQAALAAMAPAEEVSVVVTLVDQVDRRALMSRPQAGPGAMAQGDKALRRARRALLVNTLRAQAEDTQRPLRSFLTGRGLHRAMPLWIINGLEVSLPARLVPVVARRPGVVRVELNYEIQLAAPTGGGAPPEWNIAAIRAPEFWAMGYTGAGVVVANLDTGVDLNHPELAPRWRGGTHSWCDPSDPCWSDPCYASPCSAPLCQPACTPANVPYDQAAGFTGHGTGTMGLMVGGEAGGTAIGVAPGAQWIAAKVFDDTGTATAAGIHAAFQWLLDPDGDPNTDDAPGVVNNSWALKDQIDVCVLDFQSDIQTLKAAGIAVVFSAGNDGPGAATSISPANNPSGFAVGAVTQFNGYQIANFSARGPSTCDGNTYPEVVAPGAGVYTMDDGSFGGFGLYQTVSGTSFAAPHVAGAMALLLEAFPEFGADATAIAAMETLIEASALDLGAAGPDNVYGYGLLDVANAHAVHCAAGGSGPDSDGDGIVDACDNCTLADNGPLAPDAGGFSQRDTDGDGYGNLCDADLNQDNIVNALDVGSLKLQFLQTGPGLDSDFNGDGVVNALDLGILKSSFLAPPGPSGMAP